MINNEERRQAVFQNNSTYDGLFYYAVKSTRIFCRPSCKSRAPLETNITYFDTAEIAINAGYRPCKRCRPDLVTYQPAQDMAEQAKEVIDSYYNSRMRLAEELSKIGISQHRMSEIFKEQYGATPNEYADRLRIQAAKDMLLHHNNSILDIALFLEFDSLPAFYAFFRKHTQMAPREYQKNGLSAKPARQLFSQSCKNDLGRFVITASDIAVISVRLENIESASIHQQANKLTALAVKQLEEYAIGKRQHFDLPLSPIGTAFQKTVWQALETIPYGETRNYKQIAQQAGKPAASRAVGMANNKNPIQIIIPCHRVIGSNGALVGYAGGLELKKRLLKLEAQYK